MTLNQIILFATAVAVAFTIQLPFEHDQSLESSDVLALLQVGKHAHAAQSASNESFPDLKQIFGMVQEKYEHFVEHGTTNNAKSSSWPDFSNVFGLFGKKSKRPPAYDNIFMRYMPDHNVVICGCAKCGTSSLYEYIYQTEFNKSWASVYGGSQPYIHDVTTERWGGKFRMVSDAAEQSRLMKSAFSYTIIRDPRERLLSAWKSKIACGCGGEQCDFATDVGTRPMMVKTLLEVAGLDLNVSQQNGKCMDLDTFLNVISKIHKDGNARLLDRHFLPMSMGCFFEYPPEKWSKIVALKRPGALDDLAKNLGADSKIAPNSHASSGKVKLTAEAVALLDEITVPEYELIGDHLEREKSYLEERSYPLKPGIWALTREYN